MKSSTKRVVFSLPRKFIVSKMAGEGIEKTRCYRGSPCLQRSSGRRRAGRLRSGQSIFSRTPRRPSRCYLGTVAAAAAATSLLSFPFGTRERFRTAGGGADGGRAMRGHLRASFSVALGAAAGGGGVAVPAFQHGEKGGGKRFPLCGRPPLYSNCPGRRKASARPRNPGETETTAAGT